MSAPLDVPGRPADDDGIGLPVLCDEGDRMCVPVATGPVVDGVFTGEIECGSGAVLVAVSVDDAVGHFMSFSKAPAWLHAFRLMQ